MQPDFHERVKESVSAGTSRAVVLQVVAGQRDNCANCGEVVGFKANDKTPRVLCNVYIEKVWDHIETYHPDCYVEVGAPFGPPLEGAVGSASRKAVDGVIAAAAKAAQAHELSQAAGSQ